MVRMESVDTCGWWEGKVFGSMDMLYAIDIAFAMLPPMGLLPDTAWWTVSGFLYQDPYQVAEGDNEVPGEQVDKGGTWDRDRMV